MSKIRLHKMYNCSELNCQGHTAKLEFNDVVKLYQFDNGKGNKLFFDESEIATFIELLKDLRLKRKDNPSI